MGIDTYLGNLRMCLFPNGLRFVDWPSQLSHYAWVVVMVSDTRSTGLLLVETIPLLGAEGRSLVRSGSERSQRPGPLLLCLLDGPQRCIVSSGTWKPLGFSV